MKVRASLKGHMICLLLLGLSLFMGLAGQASVRDGGIVFGFAGAGCAVASIVTVVVFLWLLADAAGLSSNWRDRKRLLLAIVANVALLVLGAAAVHVNAANLRASYSNRASVRDQARSPATQGSSVTPPQDASQ